MKKGKSAKLSGYLNYKVNYGTVDSKNLKSIHMIFKIKGFVQGTQKASQTYTISGTANIPGLYVQNNKTYNGTSFQSLRKICKELENDINYDYDLLYLGYYNDSIRYGIKYSDKINIFHKIYGTYGYIITYNGALKLMENVIILNN